MPLGKFIDWEAIQSERISNVVNSTIVNEVIDADRGDRGDVLVVFLLTPEQLRQHITLQEHHLEECLFFGQESDLLL
jgi:hypothetical protein